MEKSWVGINYVDTIDALGVKTIMTMQPNTHKGIWEVKSF